jgi:hypothetical protein
MALIVPNLDREQKKDPPSAEALQKIQTYITANVAQVAGNKVPPPGFVTPGTPGG